MATMGNELGVPWIWSNRLKISVGGITVEPHPIHSLDVAGLHSNEFYGSFSIVGRDARVYQHPQHIFAHPTKAAHTEPQYFAWLEHVLDDLPLNWKNPAAFILEINQTNTPCSQQHCRPAINNAVKNNIVMPSAITVARMAAYQIYETSYPKICPTSFETSAGRKLPEDGAHVVAASMCIHRFPEKA